MQKLTMLFVGFALLTSDCCAATNPAENEIASQERSLTERVSESREIQVWEGYLRADTHIRYHMALAERWGKWALGSKVVLTVFSVLVLAFGLILSQFIKKYTWAKWISAILLCVTIAFNYIPFADWRNNHYILSQRWNGLYDDWKNLRADLLQLDSESLRTQTTALLAKEKAIEDSEPPHWDTALFERCERETDESEVAPQSANRVRNAAWFAPGVDK
jgi:hypothetical protein